MPRQAVRRPGRWLVVAAALLAAGAALGAMTALRGPDHVPIPPIASEDEAAPSRDDRPRPQDDGDDERARASADARAEEARDEPAIAAEPIGDPQRIEIPAIDVDAEIVPVGLRDDGAMEVPDFGLAGWYTEGPRPGEEGPSTVIAHVDSRSGPDVFARLRELEAGDEVRLHGEDGTVTFVVEAGESAPKDDLPVDRIWGWTDEPTLRLLTCDGLFDRSVGHYEDNLIVYLSLLPG